jgi:predicted O-methyltransferase YrrM
LSNRTIAVDDRLYRYLLDHSLREPAALRRLREYTMKHERARMQIAPEQGQFMGLLVRLMGVRQAIEIGTFTGYSAAWMALALPPDGRLICCDQSAEWTAIGIPYWDQLDVRDRIDLRIAPALDTLNALIGEGRQGQFDLVFIDADKENYLDYYERALELLRPGGLALFDNSLWDGRVADPRQRDPETEAIRALNRHLHQDQRIDLSLVPIGDGLSLARKR